MQKKNKLNLPSKFKKLTEEEMKIIKGGARSPIKRIGDWLKNTCK